MYKHQKSALNNKKTKKHSEDPQEAHDMSWLEKKREG